ncbi:DUF6691 family protein [Paracoccus sp. (in: a-proteobacteria)]|uniref:DUF6691 family protein n=1 Tax=Paracoccus sp. TaxID=267 RepID=UPI0026E077CA|nr:DUF6691 family protein [Paracoccus sp. (in: a-proteobacteria)]MDO5647792.1 hypothetical protein [Paracoccus sp. (in: a-proteobacteria)]
MRVIIAALSGGLFGAGLVVSGMTDPARVQGWLDVFGAWDPTLGFVLTGAIIPMLMAWHGVGRLVGRVARNAPPPPPPPTIDARLITGAALFGLGWGLAGLCPGPAIASLAYGGVPVLIFAAAMASGMALFGIWSRR